jgi:hypothetical protein
VRFRVNSTKSNIVIGVAMVPAIALLCVAFAMGDRGEIGLAVAAGVGFLAVLMPAGLWARKLAREIEIDERGIREGNVEIRWDEPHELTYEARVARNKGIAVSGQAIVRVRAGEREIAYRTLTRTGMVGIAAKVGKGGELVEGADATEQAIAHSTAALLARARATVAEGGRARFGDVEVSKQGVHLGDAVVPVASVRLEPSHDGAGRGMWEMHVASGSKRRFAIAELPNAAVLDALLREAR